MMVVMVVMGWMEGLAARAVCMGGRPGLADWD